MKYTLNTTYCAGTKPDTADLQGISQAEIAEGLAASKH